MRIGVVCSHEGRFDFFRHLLSDHCVVRIPADWGEQMEDLSTLDGILVDIRDLGEPPNLPPILQQQGFLFAAHEEVPPCIVRYGKNGALQLAVRPANGGQVASGTSDHVATNMYAGLPANGNRRRQPPSWAGFSYVSVCSVASSLLQSPRSRPCYFAEPVRIDRYFGKMGFYTLSLSVRQPASQS